MVTQFCTVAYFLIEVVAYYLIGKKLWWSWVVKGIGVIPLTVINVTCDLPVFHLLNGFFLWIYWRNVREWRREG